MPHSARNTSRLLELTLALLVCLAFSSNVLGGKLYTVKRTDVDFFLAEIDTQTLQIREAGPLLTQFSNGGLAWDPETGTLYMVSASDEYLWTIDTVTGRASIIGEHHNKLQRVDLNGLAYDCKNQILWATSYRGKFYSINPDDASPVEISTNTWGEDFPNDGMFGLAYNFRQDALLAFQPSRGLLYQLNWRSGGGKVILGDFEDSFAAHGLAYDSDQNLYWAVNTDGQLFSVDPATGFKKTLHRSDLGSLDGLAYAHEGSCEQRPFQINYGITDAWYDQNVPGQGYFINVLPQSQTMFIGWFTYDLDGFSQSYPTVLGAPEHRWLTAQGAYHDDVADLDVYLTKGGLFNFPEPRAETSEYGKLKILFGDCEKATMEFSLRNQQIQGQVHLLRVSNQRVSLCEEVEFRTPEG